MRTWRNASTNSACSMLRIRRRVARQGDVRAKGNRCPVVPLRTRCHPRQDEDRFSDDVRFPNLVIVPTSRSTTRRGTAQTIDAFAAPAAAVRPALFPLRRWPACGSITTPRVERDARAVQTTPLAVEAHFRVRTPAREAVSASSRSSLIRHEASGVWTPLRSISVTFARRRSFVSARFASAIQRAYSFRCV